jgi:hypothetical protein
LTVGCASYFLIATSDVRPPPQDCRHEAESVTFLVSGECGAAGQIVVHSPANECAIFVQGASAVGLPSAGRFDYFEGSKQVSLANHPWTLRGPPPAPDSPDPGGPEPRPDGGNGIDAGGAPVLTTHPTPETWICAHTVEQSQLKLTSEKLACHDSADRKACSPALTRL